MRTVFPSYPDGAAGVGLFVLRVSALSSLQVVASQLEFPDWRHLVVAFLGLGLLVGVRTRFLAGLSMAAAISALAGGTGLAAMIAPMLDACALLFVGPGAYSVDARLFGRRTIIVPSNSEG